MAGDWVEWSKGLARKREVVLLASKLGRDRHEIAGRLMGLWEWCDDNLASDAFDGEENAMVKICDAVPNLSQNCPANARQFLDEILGIAGFADSLASPDVGWLIVHQDGSVMFPKLGRHNGETSKQRAYDRKRKRKQREVSPKCPENNGTNLGLEKRGARGEKSIQSREDRSGEPLDQSRRGGNSSKAGKPAEHALELPPDFDWEEVKLWASEAGKRVPPQSPEDRRAWIRYAVMAKVSFSEGWLIGAAEQARVADTKTNRRAHFVAVLKATALESQGMDAETFNGIAKRIEIPSAVWKSEILFVEKKR